MQDALFAPPPAPAVHHGEPDGRKTTRKSETKTGTWTWSPYRVATRTACMACTRDLRAGVRNDIARQAVWQWTPPAGTDAKPLVVCSEHKQEAVDGGL